jgi:hypothetical protein
VADRSLTAPQMLERVVCPTVVPLTPLTPPAPVGHNGGPPLDILPNTGRNADLDVPPCPRRSIPVRRQRRVDGSAGDRPTPEPPGGC